jgi:hypothetical protein
VPGCDAECGTKGAKDLNFCIRRLTCSLSTFIISVVQKMTNPA